MSPERLAEARAVASEPAERMSLGVRSFITLVRDVLSDRDHWHDVAKGREPAAGESPEMVPFSRLGGVISGLVPASVDPDGLACCFAIWVGGETEQLDPYITQPSDQAPVWVDVPAAPSQGQVIIGSALHEELAERSFIVKAVVWYEHNLAQVVLDELVSVEDDE